MSFVYFRYRLDLRFSLRRILLAFDGKIEFSNTTRVADDTINGTSAQRQFVFLNMRNIIEKMRDFFLNKEIYLYFSLIHSRDDKTNIKKNLLFYSLSPVDACNITSPLCRQAACAAWVYSSIVASLSFKKNQRCRSGVSPSFLRENPNKSSPGRRIEVERDRETTNGTSIRETRTIVDLSATISEEGPNLCRPCSCRRSANTILLFQDVVDQPERNLGYRWVCRSAPSSIAPITPVSALESRLGENSGRTCAHLTSKKQLHVEIRGRCVTLACYILLSRVFRSCVKLRGWLVYKTDTYMRSVYYKRPSRDSTIVWHFQCY